MSERAEKIRDDDDRWFVSVETSTPEYSSVCSRKRHCEVARCEEYDDACMAAAAPDLYVAVDELLAAIAMNAPDRIGPKDDYQAERIETLAEYLRSAPGAASSMLSELLREGERAINEVNRRANERERQSDRDRARNEA